MEVKRAPLFSPPRLRTKKYRQAAPAVNERAVIAKNISKREADGKMRWRDVKRGGRIGPARYR